jgi:hypothetical protein
VYLDPKALRQHVKQVHERSRQLHCVECEFIFSSKYALNRHVREVHNKQQEYSCNHCSKQFTQQSNLKQHMLIHLGAKPFLCQHDHQGCKAAFTTKQCLQVHYRYVLIATLSTLTTELRGRWHRPRYKQESKQTFKIQNQNFTVTGLQSAPSSAKKVPS